MIVFTVIAHLSLGSVCECGWVRECVCVCHCLFVFSAVMACGKKLFLSLLVLVLMDLQCLPEGNRSKR